MAESNVIELPVAQGDWHLRGLSAEQRCALNPLPDDCIDAAIRATNEFFDPRFPGWEIYSRIVRGDTCFDRRLAAWAIGFARSFARAKRLTGHPSVASRVRRNAWLTQAALDGLEHAISGNALNSAHQREQEFGIDDKLYIRVRATVARVMRAGFNDYAMVFGFQLWQVRRESWTEQKNKLRPIRRNPQNWMYRWGEKDAA